MWGFVLAQINSGFICLKNRNLVSELQAFFLWFLSITSGPSVCTVGILEAFFVLPSSKIAKQDRLQDRKLLIWQLLKFLWSLIGGSV